MDGVQPLGSVLVIGGSGFLGARMVQRLLDTRASIDVSVLDIRIPHTRVPGARYYEGDICSEDRVQHVFEAVRPNVVFHMASPPPFDLALDFLLSINVGGTQNLLQCAEEVQTVRAFVYTSSCSIVHDADSDTHFYDEDHPTLCRPTYKDAYSYSKSMAEALVLRWNRRSAKMLTVALRPAGIFGEGDTTIARVMIDGMRYGKSKFQIGNNKNLYDFTYVDNVNDAHILAARALLRTWCKEAGESEHLEWMREKSSFDIKESIYAQEIPVSEALNDPVHEPMSMPFSDLQDHQNDNRMTTLIYHDLSRQPENKSAYNKTSLFSPSSSESTLITNTSTTTAQINIDNDSNRSTSKYANDQKIDGEAFNITNACPIPFWTICRSLSSSSSSSSSSIIIKIPKPIGLALVTILSSLIHMCTFGYRRAGMTIRGLRYGTMSRTFSGEKARDRLGYVPAVSMDEAIKRTREWFVRFDLEEKEEKMRKEKMRKEKKRGKGGKGEETLCGMNQVRGSVNQSTINLRGKVPEHISSNHSALS